MQAISTNAYHIEKMAEEKSLTLTNRDVLKIAKWNYFQYGYGRVSLDNYLHRYKKNDSRLYSVNVKFWYYLLKTIFERDNYTCTYCGAIGGKLEGDHIIPFSKGGSDELSNLTTSCRKCNRQKKDKTLSEFITWRQLKIINSNG